MANTTQGLAIALFGAYAGGYTAQLDADIAKSGLGPVAESLLGLQGPILGMDLSDDAAFIEVVLGNLGIDATNAAYNAAVAWFQGALPVLGRGGAVAAAIEYLLGDDVDAAYADVAEAFAANVAAGEEFSADSTELDVAALQAAENDSETGVTAPLGFNLTAALADLTAAEEAVADFLADLDLDDDADTDTTPADVVAELTGAVEAFDANDFSTVDYNVEGTAAQKAAVFQVARDNAAAAEQVAKTAVQTAQANVNSTAATAAEIAAYDKANAAEAAANTAKAAAINGLEDAELLFNSANHQNGVGITSDTDTWTGVDYDGATDLIVESNVEGVFKVATAIVTAGTAVGAGAPAKALLADAQAVLAAYQAAYDAEQERADAAGAQDAAETALGGETADVDTLLAAQGDYADAKEGTAALEALIDDVEAAEELNGQLADLDDAVTAAEVAIAKAGFDLNAVGYDLSDALNAAGFADLNGDFDLEEREVIFVAAGDDDLSTTDFAAGDVIAVSGYTYNDGAADKDGNDAVKEFFVEETNAGVVITFEESNFGSNAASPEVVVVTLTGLTLDDISVGSAYIVGL